MADENAEELTTAATPKLLRRLAGETYFERGEDYFDDGAVRSLQPHALGVKAVVQGTRRYKVHLWAEDNGLGHDCSCPLGRDGEFCKHCVAVGLAWHAAGGVGGAGAGTSADGSPESPDADLRDYLLRLDREDLVALVLEQADEDERFQRRLMLQAARAVPGGASPSAWKEALDGALETADFVHYREAHDYASGIEEVVESLEQMLRDGQADRVVELAEYGLDEVEECLGFVDDSEGWMGSLLSRLQELHLEACRQARPDPVDLAERLFEAEMASTYDTFYRAALVYAEILGDAGLAVYRRLAEAEWAKVPALGPGDRALERLGDRFRITSIMEALALASDDFEALVAVKSRDLSSPYAFLRIAELCRDRGDPDRALDWAERGWQAFERERRDARLRAFIAEAYQAQGRREEAVALMWEAFSESPSLATYKELKRHAERAGTWSGQRDKALALIRQRIGDEKPEPPGRPPWARSPLRDHSLLVDIFLDEGDAAAAWREARAGGCSGPLWLALAETRAQSHPEDAVQIYKAHVAGLLRNTGDQVYREAVGFLEKIEAIQARCGEEPAFRTYLIELRTAQKRKRNLMKLLDQKGW